MKCTTQHRDQSENEHAPFWILNVEMTTNWASVKMILWPLFPKKTNTVGWANSTDTKVGSLPNLSRSWTNGVRNIRLPAMIAWLKLSLTLSEEFCALPLRRFLSMDSEGILEQLKRISYYSTTLSCPPMQVFWTGVFHYVFLIDAVRILDTLLKYPSGLYKVAKLSLFLLLCRI